jgi:hypothetical protein
VRFEPVTDRAAAQVRVGFEPGDGHWSYIGRQVLKQGVDDRTMNLDPTDNIGSGDYGIDVATHEIGHTLGFPHEHQNPFSGIVWNEPAVYASLAAPPNRWSKATTFHNIIEKIVPDTVQGSKWDPNSVMHYPFEAGLIDKPVKYRKGLTPAGGLSARDRLWAHKFYPAIRAGSTQRIRPLQSKTLALAPGQQANFTFLPERTADYEFRTFGTSDTVMAIYEKAVMGLVQIAEDDDSGEARNAYIKARLRSGRTYMLRVRLRYAKAKGETAVMVW